MQSLLSSTVRLLWRIVYNAMQIVNSKRCYMNIIIIYIHTSRNLITQPSYQETQLYSQVLSLCIHLSIMYAISISLHAANNLHKTNRTRRGQLYYEWIKIVFDPKNVAISPISPKSLCNIIYLTVENTFPVIFPRVSGSPSSSTDS